MARLSITTVFTVCLIFLMSSLIMTSAAPSITDMWNFTPYSTILHFGVEDIPSSIGSNPTFSFTFNDVQLAKSLTIDTLVYNSNKYETAQYIKNIKVDSNTNPTISFDVDFPQMANATTYYVGLTFSVVKFVGTTYDVEGTIVGVNNTKLKISSDFKLQSSALAQSLDLKMPYQDKPTLIDFDVRNLAINLPANSTLALSITSGLGEELQLISYNGNTTTPDGCTLAGQSIKTSTLLSHLLLPVPKAIAAGTDSFRIRCNNLAVNTTTLNLGYKLTHNLGTQVVVEFSNFTKAQLVFAWIVVVVVLVLVIVGLLAVLTLLCYCCRCCCFARRQYSDPDYYSFNR